jgi:hypothetical protein
MRQGSVTWSEELNHIFCRLLKISGPSEGGKRNVFREEVDLQNVEFCMRIGKIAAPTAVMLQ